MFSDPARAADLVRLALPADARPLFELDSLRLVPGSFVEPDLRELYSDLLFEARMGVMRSLVYVLFEHKSSPERLTLLQLYRYMGAIWQRSRVSTSRSLARILPIVVYHGDRPWRAPLTFSDYFADASPTFRDIGPEFRPLFIDLSRLADAALALTSPATRAALLALRHAFKPALRDVQVIFGSASSDSLTETARGFLFALGTYLMRTSTEEENEAILEIITTPQEREVMMTIAEKLNQEGALRSKQEVLTRLLTKKFGLTDDERLLIQRTNDPERLTAALDEILFAESKKLVLARLIP